MRKAEVMHSGTAKDIQLVATYQDDIKHAKVFQHLEHLRVHNNNPKAENFSLHFVPFFLFSKDITFQKNMYLVKETIHSQ